MYFDRPNAVTAHATHTCPVLPMSDWSQISTES